MKSFFFFFLCFADTLETVRVNGKSAQVSEDGGFLEGSVLLRACNWQETCCKPFLGRLR